MQTLREGLVVQEACNLYFGPLHETKILDPSDVARFPKSLAELKQTRRQIPGTFQQDVCTQSERGQELSNALQPVREVTAQLKRALLRIEEEEARRRQIKESLKKKSA
jgi:hypothetical protein